MAKIKSKLDDVFERNTDDAKEAIKVLFLELIESCDSDDGSGPDLIFRDEIIRKVKEL